MDCWSGISRWQWVSDVYHKALKLLELSVRQAPLLQFSTTKRRHAEGYNLKALLTMLLLYCRVLPLGSTSAMKHDLIENNRKL